MLVVADTSPLRYHILLEHVDALRDLYGEVLVPPTVVSELSADQSVTKPVTNPFRLDNIRFTALYSLQRDGVGTLNAQSPTHHEH